MSEEILSNKQQELVAGRQFFKCANKPGSKLNGLENYECPLWQTKKKEIRGSFDESGYVIDDIDDYGVVLTCEQANLCAFCPDCYRAKEEYFLAVLEEDKKKNELKDLDDDSDCDITAVHNYVPCRIDLVPFAECKLPVLTFNNFLSICHATESLIENFIVVTNFNPTRPEHHNVYYPGLDCKFGYIYQNGTWQKRKIGRIVCDLINSTVDDLHEIISLPFLNKKTKRRINNIVLQSLEKDNLPRLTENIKRILYQNKRLVKQTRKLSENNSC